LCKSWGVGGGMEPDKNQGGGGRDSAPRAESVKLRYNTVTPQRSCSGAVEIINTVKGNAMQSKATLAYASGLAGAKRSVEFATAQLNILKINRKLIGKVTRALSKIMDEDDSVSVGVSTRDLPHMYIGMYDLESFKEDRLTKVLGYLTETMDDMKTEDWPRSVNRDFRFTSKTHSVTVSAYVRSDSPDAAEW